MRRFRAYRYEDVLNMTPADVLLLLEGTDAENLHFETQEEYAAWLARTT